MMKKIMTENNLALAPALYAVVVPGSLVVGTAVETTAMVVLEDPSSGKPLCSPKFPPPPLTPPLLFLLSVLLLRTHCPKSTTKRYQWGCPSSGG
ncbi:hypothetical protein B0T09DRAFT_331905 [Sordaria sp. MPI-SDFR-AT-0083]|nr:hypothetical protein B0T09DRAFT_331905 [Sordaria sp. MPI-SDFR-AT-0083]